MKLLITGSRDLTGPHADRLVHEAIADSGWAGDITEIVHGGARGIDAAVHRVCKGVFPETVIGLRSFNAYQEYLSPDTRDCRQALYADALIVIRKRGIGNIGIIKAMRQLGKKVFVKEV